jgi:dihydroorotase
VRTAADVEALREALADGTIDAIATDHAPHAPELKDQEWEHAPCGMLGLETAFAVVNTELIASGLLDPLTAIARFTTGPAERPQRRRPRRSDRGGPAGEPRGARPGGDLDVDATALHSRARNSPFAGRELRGRAVHTLLRGRFTLRDGHVVTGAEVAG